MDVNYSPIILFVYKRLDHVIKTVSALKANPEAEQSVLYIFSDAAANAVDKDGVKAVRKYINELDGFKEVIVIERETNWGIEKSEIDGVSFVLNECGKAIVVEDDLEVCDQFLYYMNQGLYDYKDDKRVYTITGYSFLKTDTANDGVYGYTRSFCAWGWGTWLDRWQNFKKTVDKRDVRFVMAHKTSIDNGQDFSYLFMHQYKYDKLTWDVAWYYSSFVNGGLTVFPYNTMVNNIGMDGSGVHYKDSKRQNRIESINERKKVRFPLEFVSLEKATADILDYSKFSHKKKLIKKMKMFVRFWLNALEILVFGKKSIELK